MLSDFCYGRRCRTIMNIGNEETRTIELTLCVCSRHPRPRWCFHSHIEGSEIWKDIRNMCAFAIECTPCQTRSRETLLDDAKRRLENRLLSIRNPRMSFKCSSRFDWNSIRRLNFWYSLMHSIEWGILNAITRVIFPKTRLHARKKKHIHLISWRTNLAETRIKSNKIIQCASTICQSLRFASCVCSSIDVTIIPHHNFWRRRWPQSPNAHLLHQPYSVGCFSHSGPWGSPTRATKDNVVERCVLNSSSKVRSIRKRGPTSVCHSSLNNKLRYRHSIPFIRRCT